MVDDTVVDFSVGQDLKKKPREYNFCRCNQVLVNDHTRMLECQHCGKVIDPFDYIWRQANNQERNVFAVRHKKDEIKKFNDEIEELKRVKRNLQGQVNRLKKKT